MLFKKLRSSSSSTLKKPPTTNIQRLSSPQSDAAKNEPKCHAQVITRETSEDYETFLENAKEEAEKKEKAALRMAKEAERRRREFNMDSWASRV
jgi:hypothetical protein